MKLISFDNFYLKTILIEVNLLILINRIFQGVPQLHPPGLPALHLLQHEPHIRSDQHQLFGPFQQEAAPAGQGHPRRPGDDQGGQGDPEEAHPQGGGRLRRRHLRQGEGERHPPPHAGAHRPRRGQQGTCAPPR